MNILWTWFSKINKRRRAFEWASRRGNMKFTFINFTPTHEYVWTPCTSNDWWKYLQITVVVYFMKTTARLSQWLAQNHVHIYHILETHMELLLFSSLSNINCTQLKLFYFFFVRKQLNKFVSIFLLAFRPINTSIQVKMASFIKTRIWNCKAIKKKLNVFG